MKKEKLRVNSRKKAENPSFADRITNNYMAWPIFFVFTFLIYGQLLGFFLGKFDEDLLILGNLGKLQDFANIKMAFMRDAFLSKEGASFYRPLQTLTFMVDAHFFFKQGTVFYFTNIIIHFLTGCALFYFLKQLGKQNNLSAFLLTLLFLASPLFVHAVAWAPSRGDLLIGLFGLLTMIFYLDFLRDGKYTFSGLTALMFLLAMFSKETAIILPVIMVIFYFIPAVEKKIGLTRILTLAGLMTLVVVLYFTLRSMAFQTSSPADFGIAQFIRNLRTIPEFVAKFFIPLNLAPMAGFTALNTFLGLILLAILIFLILRSSKPQMMNLSAGILWFLFFAVPGVMYSHTLGSSAYDYLEHRAYLPAMGLILIMFFLLGSPSAYKRRDLYLWIIGLGALSFAIYANIYAKNYRNPLVFYNYAVEANPNSALACLNRGNLRSELKDYKGAMEDNEKAIELNPRYAQAWVNKGILLASDGKDEQAIAAYDSAIKYHPGLFQAHFNKANLQLRRQNYEEAIKGYNEALRLNPDHLPGYSARALAYYHLKNYDISIKDLDYFIERNQSDINAYLNRGKTWFALKNREKACADWTKAQNLGSNEATTLLKTYCQP